MPHFATRARNETCAFEKHTTNAWKKRLEIHGNIQKNTTISASVFKPVLVSISTSCFAFFLLQNQQNHGIWDPLGASRGISGILGVPSGVPGGLSGSPWGPLGGSLGALGVLWGSLGAPWGASWVPFGPPRALLGALGDVFPSKIMKTYPEPMKHRKKTSYLEAPYTKIAKARCSRTSSGKLH